METGILSELGLSKNEIEVYLTLLELGTSTAVHIAKAAKLHRPNVYDALDRLSKKSLVSHSIREGTKYYEVADPDQLMSLLKTKEIQVQSLIPELKVKQLEAKPASTVAVFEGVAGARRMMQEIVNSTKEFYVLGVPRDYAKTLGEGWVKEWHADRVRKKVWFHHIVNEDYYSHRINFLRALKYTSIKFLPKEYNAPNVLFIYDKGVVLVFMQPFISIRILSEDAAQSFKQYYQLLESISMDKAPQERVQEAGN